MKISKTNPCGVSCMSVFSWVVMMVANMGRNGVAVAAGGGGPSSKYFINSRVGCVDIDSLCLSPADVSNYEAIRTLHSQLDDDRNGDIDLAESVEFLKDELQYTKGYEKRQETFHHNNDKAISVEDLWHIWKQSEVHNWTVEQTVAWLGETVELSIYAKNFYENAINGSVLPSTVLGILTGHDLTDHDTSSQRLSRMPGHNGSSGWNKGLAANNEQFITRVLGIKDPSHRSKITIKAMDAVLFGPPKGSHLKDLVLVTLLTLALLGCFKAYQRNREYQTQLSNMMKDMEKLREAEENLQALEKNTRNPLRRGSAFDADNPPEYVTNEVVQQLRQELEEERQKCCRLQQEMEGVESEERHVWDPPLALQHWLQLTYERERLAFEKKHLAAREQFNQAKEMCEKLNKQRRSVMGMLSSVHGKMDNIDQSISRARTTMEEVTQELSERDNRWSNIEMLAGFNITKNAGLHTLELMLRPQVNGGRPHSIYSPSIEDFMGYDFDMEMSREYSYFTSRYGDLAPPSSSSCSSGSRESSSQPQRQGYKPLAPNVSQGTSVHQLLSNQSALMYLTMGGTTSAASGLGSATPTIHEANSVADVRLGAHSSGSSRKKSHLLTRDSGSSIGSENSASALGTRMRYSQSQNFSSDTSVYNNSVEEEDFPRSVSTTSLRTHHRSSSQINKDDSSTDETDHSPSISDSTSFSIGGSPSSRHLQSRLTLNSEGGRTITESQACENMSASEPSLDNPKSTTVSSSSLRSKQKSASNFEEGNSSDSSLNSSLPSPNADHIKKKKWFANNISSRLSLGKSKKKKDKDLDKDKESIKQESISGKV